MVGKRGACAAQLLSRIFRIAVAIVPDVFLSPRTELKTAADIAEFS
jgi:hypothetical protein